MQKKSKEQAKVQDKDMDIEAEAEEVAEAGNDPVSQAQSKKGRVCLKNLVYDVNERMLRRSFGQYGEISEINIPINPSNNKPRGFAFIQFSSKNSAAKMVSEWNEKKWKGREISVTFSQDKRDYVQSKKKDSQAEGAVKQQPQEKTDGVEVVPAGDKKPAKFDKKKNAKVVKEELEEDDYDDLDNLVMQNVMGLEDEFSFEDEDGDIGDEQGGEDEDEEGSAQDESESQELGQIRELDLFAKDSDYNTPLTKNEKKKVNKEKLEEKDINSKKPESKKPVRDPLEQDEDLSCTVFVRGIPFETDEKKFLSFCQEIGEVFYAKVVKMKDNSGRHNGNGFIKFKDQSVAKRVIEMTTYLDLGNYIPKEDDPNLFISGSRIKFFSTLTKKIALGKFQERQKELKDKQFNKEADVKTMTKDKRKKVPNKIESLIETDSSDKRRLKYSLLGFNAVDEKTFKALGQAEVAQRKEYQDEKKEKMKNPNMFVSSTRVVFKNLAKHFDQRQLGMRIKEILGKGLSKHGVSEELSNLNKRKIFKQVKIMTEEDNEGKTQSKGTAFVEFTEPEHAECFLKSVDDIKVGKTFGDQRLPLIEFAFEDIRKMKEIEKMKEAQKLKLEKEASQNSGSGMVNKFMQKSEHGKKFKDGKPQDRGAKSLEQKKQENQKNLINARLREIQKNPQSFDLKFIRETYHLAQNRGKKQRLKNLFEALYPGFSPYSDEKQKSGQNSNQQGKPNLSAIYEKQIKNVEANMSDKTKAKFQGPEKVKQASFESKGKPENQKFSLKSTETPVQNKSKAETDELFAQALKYVEFDKKDFQQRSGSGFSRKDRKQLKKRNPNARNGMNSERTQKFEQLKTKKDVRDEFDDMTENFLKKKLKTQQWDKKQLILNPKAQLVCR